MKARRHSLLAAVGLALAFAASITCIGAAQPTYLTLSGSVQGPILGSVTNAGKVGTIEAAEVHHLIHRAVGGGLTHEPFIFTKGVDRSTVNLYRAMNNGELLSAIFRYYRVDGTGLEVQYYTIELNGATVVAIEPIKADIIDTASLSRPDQERIRMDYRDITIRYLAEETEAETLAP